MKHSNYNQDMYGKKITSETPLSVAYKEASYFIKVHEIVHELVCRKK